MSPTPNGATKPNWPSTGGGIFISYRRSDSSGYVGRIAGKLRTKFRRRDVFRDLSAIAPGEQFPAAIDAALKDTSVLLAIIGPEWLRIRDETGNLRLSNPKDYVRLEILTAMQHKLRVVPVLVGGASMPKAEELPEDLRDQRFSDLQCFELSDLRWKYDLDRLIAVIRLTVDPWFRIRQGFLVLIAVTTLIVGLLVKNHIVEERRIEEAGRMVDAGHADEALKALKDLEGKNAPERADARIYLHEAEAYQAKGEAINQNSSAVKAAERALARGDYLTAGRASMLACDAKDKLGLPDEALSECKDAQKYSALAKPADVVGQVRAITAQANLLRATNRSDAAVQAYCEALNFALEHKLVPDQYGAMNNLGLALQDEGQLDEAKAKFKAAKEGFEKNGLFGEASNACSNLGTVSLRPGNIDEAEGYFEEALVLANQSNDEARVAQVHVNKGVFHEQSGSPKLAEAEFTKARDIYVSLGLEGEVGFVNNNLGDVYLQEAKYDDARRAYSEALKVPDVHAWSATCLVNLDLEQGRSTATDLLGRIESARLEAEDAGDKESESFARLIKAHVLLQSKRFADAKTEAEEALRQAKGRQPDTEVGAQILVAELKAINGLNELEVLADSTYHNNVPRNLEARLTSARVMLQFGSAKQRSDARVLLSVIQADAQGMNYNLWAAKAQALLQGNAESLTQ